MTTTGHPAATVYTNPVCVQCHATCTAMVSHGIAYQKIDVTTDPFARDYVLSLGYLQAPVVVAGELHWSGFRPDRIKALTNPAAFATDATAVSA